MLVQARRQHVGNLVFLMRHYAATRDWGCLAGVAAALVASDVRHGALQRARQAA